MKQWSDKDRTLALALEIHESSSTMGLPNEVVYDVELGQWIDVKTRTNMAQAALDRWHKENPKPDPGTEPYLVY
ncbi:hypothetical protein, partial [Timonella senegalensis]